MSNLEIIIPYYSGNLGKAYNTAMKKVDDWALLIDHDIIILTPNWFDMCIETIKKLGKKAGWITCRTNSIWCVDQLDINCPSSDNMLEHLKYARSMAGPPTIIESSGKRFDAKGIFSGFFILTHKEAWENVSGFIEEDSMVIHDGFRFKCNKHLGVDNDYFYRLKNYGYKSYIITNLYAYHLRELKTKK